MTRSIKLGTLIQSHRVRQGLSRTEVAQMVGIPTAHVQQIERGMRGVTDGLLLRFAKCLQIAFTELYTAAGRLDSITTNYLRATPLAMILIDMLALYEADESILVSLMA